MYFLVNVFLCNCGAGLEVQVGWGQGAAGHVFQARPTGEVIDFSCREYQPHYRGLGGGAAPACSRIGIIPGKGIISFQEF